MIASKKLSSRTTGQRAHLQQTKANEAQDIVHAFDDEIVKLAQMRELLTDAGILALTKQLFENHMTRATVRTHSRVAGTRAYGGLVRAVFESVDDIGDEPFTKWDLAERLPQKGYEIKEPTNRLFYPIQRLVADGIIKLIEQGGGNRPNAYQRVKANRAAEAGASIEHSERNEIGPSDSAVSRQLRLRNGMERIAVECIVRLTQPFVPQELITEMRAAGFAFVGNADRSIQPVLRRLVKEEILEIVQESDGLRPKVYRRRNTE